jgi:hypothetical protein
MERQLITKAEQVDDIALLLVRMCKRRLAELIDERFPVHGNWQSLA